MSFDTRYTGRSRMYLPCRPSIPVAMQHNTGGNKSIRKGLQAANNNKSYNIHTMANKHIDAAFKSLGAELKIAMAKLLAAQEIMLESQPPELIVEKVKNGEMLPPSQCLEGWNNLKLRQSLFEAGLLHSIVSFLNKGAHDEEFKLGAGVRSGFYLTIEGGGKGKFEHVSPKIWLYALVQSIAEESSLNTENCDKLCVDIAKDCRPFIAQL
eukprot:scaffold6522_cov118-Skeletonema_dohrnii-CCMP3373.AAC.1